MRLIIAKICRQFELVGWEFINYDESIESHKVLKREKKETLHKPVNEGNQIFMSIFWLTSDTSRIWLIISRNLTSTDCSFQLPLSEKFSIE